MITPVEAVTLRIRWLLYSAMYTLPLLSTLMPQGLLNAADVAAPLSPLKLAVPVPAMVEMMPVETVILRTRLLLESPIYTLPAGEIREWLVRDESQMQLFNIECLPLISRAIPTRKFIVALVAGPLSPLKLAVPVPAMVEIILSGVILRTRLLVPSLK